MVHATCLSHWPLASAITVSACQLGRRAKYERLVRNAPRVTSEVQPVKLRPIAQRCRLRLPRCLSDARTRAPALASDAAVLLPGEAGTIVLLGTSGLSPKSVTVHSLSPRTLSTLPTMAAPSSAQTDAARARYGPDVRP